MSDRGIGNERGTDPPAENLAVFQSRLRRFKREGCNLLVVGDVPRKLFAKASESMLGDADARRWRVFGLTDAAPESVRDRLPAPDVTPRPRSETTKIVSHTVGSQRTATATSGNGMGTGVIIPESGVPEVDVSDAGLAEFRRELLSAVETFGARSHRPAEVRLSVDSLAPLFDRYGPEAVRGFLRTVTDSVHDWNVMAHYVLPVAYDSDRCQRLVSEFDAVVELRTTPDSGSDRPSADSPRPHSAEERWHLPESDATMPWVPL